MNTYMLLFFRLYNKKRSYDPIDYECIDKTEFWIIDKNEPRELDWLEIQISSQTISSFRCERNWTLFEHIYTKKRNRLEHQRFNDLVYAHYNLRLKNWYRHQILS